MDVKNNLLKELERSGDYSSKFDELRLNRLAMSVHKYGHAKNNFGKHFVSALGSLQKCIDKYTETGNTEYLVDAANYVMFEFMYPSVSGATFVSTDSDASAGIDGISEKEMEEYKSEDSTYLPY